MGDESCAPGVETDDKYWVASYGIFPTWLCVTVDIQARVTLPTVVTGTARILHSTLY